MLSLMIAACYNLKNFNVQFWIFEWLHGTVFVQLFQIVHNELYARCLQLIRIVHVRQQQCLNHGLNGQIGTQPLLAKSLE